MSEAARQTKNVYEAALAVHESGQTDIRPGDIAAHLRDSGFLVAAWLIRGELTNLEAMGLVTIDTESATWRIVEGRTFSIEEADSSRRTA